MEKIKTDIGILICLVLLLSPTFGESIWVKYGNQVFRGAGDAKAIALSEAEVASATGPMAVLWNPARLLAEDEKYFIYAHQERFSGSVIYDVIGFDLKDTFKSKWSMVLIREAVQGIPNTTRALLYDTGSLDAEYERILPDRVTYFNQVQWASILGIATSRGDWKMGGNVKLLVHQLGKRNGYGMGFDFGMYRNLTPKNTMAVTLRDASTSWVIWETGTVERIAPQLLLGDEQIFLVKSLNLQIKAIVAGIIDFAGQTNSDDISMESIGLGIHARAGIDIRYKKNFHLRMGRNPLTGYSTGLGLRFPFGVVDYAFTPSPLGSVLGNSHYISVKLKIEFLKMLKEKVSGEM